MEDKYYIIAKIPHANIQMRLFEEGYEWPGGGKELKNLNEDMLLLIGDNPRKQLSFLRFSSTPDPFKWMQLNRADFKEITLDQLFRDDLINKEEIDEFNKELIRDYG